MTGMLEFAHRLVQAGVSVLPVRADGTKAPALPAWKEWQTRVPTPLEIREFFAGREVGIAVVCGAVSGNLAVLDFDDPAVFSDFTARAIEQGLGSLLETIPCARTPSGGFHLYFRAPEPVGTQVLARTDDGGVGVEVRGCGAYAVVPPSPAECHPERKPYRMLRGDLADLPQLDAETTEDLLAIARSLDLQPRAFSVRISGDARPGDVYNQEADVLALLVAHGWRVAGNGHGGWTHLTRPGKSRGVSASWHESRRLFHVFSTNAQPFRAGETYTPFAVYALLEHGGDFTRAAKAVASRNGSHPQTAHDRAGEDVAVDDLRHARELLRLWRGIVRWCTERRQWLCWNGTVWEAVPDEAMTVRAMETLRQRYAGQIAEPGADVRDLSARLRETCSKPRMERALAVLAGMEGILAHASDFDRDVDAINTATGIVDLRTGAVEPHAPERLFTRSTGAKYDPQADCPRWRQFLLEIFDGDVQLADFVQRAVGYSLLGGNPEHLLFILHGTGANGKSTFLAVLRTVLGEYAGTVPRDALVTTKQAQDAKRTAYAALAGIRFGVLNELSDESVLASTALKDLTSGDTLAVRSLYENYREVRLQLTPFVACNVKPRITEHTPAVWRRLRLIPFPVTIPPARRDPLLAEKLLAEADGILAWAVAGAVDYCRHGLREPAGVLEATAEYRTQEDVLSAFLEECCEFAPRAQTPTAELYQAYRMWSQETGIEAGDVLGNTAFGRELTKRGFGTKHTRGGWVRVGIRLKEKQTVTGVTDVTHFLESPIEKNEEQKVFGNASTSVTSVTPTVAAPPVSGVSNPPSSDEQEVEEAPDWLLAGRCQWCGNDLEPECPRCPNCGLQVLNDDG